YHEILSTIKLSNLPMRRPAVSNPVPEGTCTLEDQLADPVQGNSFFRCPDMQGFPRHAKHYTTVFILGKGARASLAHRQHPLGTVLAHAGENDAYRVLACDFGSRMKQHVDRRPVPVDRI